MAHQLNISLHRYRGNGRNKLLDDETTEATSLSLSTHSQVSQKPHKSRVRQRGPPRVQFARSNSVVEVKHIADMDEEEREQIWYLEEDYAAIRKEAQAISAQHEQGDENVDVRGLENRYRSKSTPRDSEKKEALRVVLQESWVQRVSGSNNDEVVANAYITASCHFQDSAYAAGLRDEEAIRDELEQTRKDFAAVVQEIKIKKSRRRIIKGFLKRMNSRGEKSRR